MNEETFEKIIKGTLIDFVEFLQKDTLAEVPAEPKYYVDRYLSIKNNKKRS